MKILVADDHELFLDGLKLALEELDENLETIAAYDYNQLVDALDKHKKFDLILSDLAMPGMPWDDALKLVRSKCPETPIVILSAVHDRDIVLKAVEIGASGFIPKTSSNRIIIGALQLVLNGGIYLPPELLESHISNHQDLHAAQSLNNNDAIKDILTPRQRDVLVLIGQGKSNKVIARELGLSEGTVKLHVTAILKALDVSNRTGAVVAASKLGLSPMPSDN